MKSLDADGKQSQAQDIMEKLHKRWRYKICFENNASRVMWLITSDFFDNKQFIKPNSKML
jgi:hypothetical protein